jgi:hypothetical protein
MQALSRAVPRRVRRSPPSRPDFRRSNRRLRQDTHATAVHAAGQHAALHGWRADLRRAVQRLDHHQRRRGPTDDKRAVILETPRDPDRLSSLLNIRVRDIAAVYAEWRARGAHFLTPPKHHQYEIRCYIRDADGCIIKVGRPPTRTATGRPISGSPPAYSGAAACAGTLVGAYLSAATTARHVADAVEWGAGLITGRPTLLYWQLTVNKG